MVGATCHCNKHATQNLCAYQMKPWKLSCGNKHCHVITGNTRCHVRNVTQCVGEMGKAQESFAPFSCSYSLCGDIVRVLISHLFVAALCQFLAFRVGKGHHLRQQTRCYWVRV